MATMTFSLELKVSEEPTADDIEKTQSIVLAILSVAWSQGLVKHPQSSIAVRGLTMFSMDRAGQEVNSITVGEC